MAPSTAKERTSEEISKASNLVRKTNIGQKRPSASRSLSPIIFSNARAVLKARMPSPTLIEDVDRETTGSRTGDDPDWQESGETNIRRMTAKQPNKRRTSLHLPIQIGGLRKDPFNMFPIESKGQISEVFDFFAQVYAPVAIHPPDNAAGKWLRSTLFSTYFQTMLHDAMLFEAIIAFSMVMRTLHREPKMRVTPQMLYHSNMAISKLRSRLLDKDLKVNTSDTVILTVVLMVGLQHSVGDFEAVRIHVEALRRIVSLRGGYDSLGWGGYIKARVLNAEAGWVSRQRIEQQRKSSGRKGGGRLSYPVHPFDPPLCRKIAQFSAGFRELALERSLSIQFLDFLELVVIWLGKKSDLSATTSASMIDSVLGLSPPKMTEHLLAVALLAYCAFVEQTLEQVNPPLEMYVHTQVKILGSSSDVVACKDRDALAWAGLILRETTDRRTGSWRWADRILSNHEIPMNEKRQRELEGNFLPIPLRPEST